MKTVAEIFTIITPIISIIISAAVSYTVAKINAKNEFKKLSLSLNHENLTVSRDAFSNLIATVCEYCSFCCGANHSSALKANSKFIAVAPDCCQPILLELSKAIELYDVSKMQKLSNQLTVTYSQYIQNANNSTDNK